MILLRVDILKESRMEVDRYLGNQLIVKTINSYDDFSRLTGIVHENSTGVISTHSYDYDALNHLPMTRMATD
jgi:hypothetical protein